MYVLNDNLWNICPNTCTALYAHVLKYHSRDHWVLSFGWLWSNHCCIPNKAYWTSVWCNYNHYFTNQTPIKRWWSTQQAGRWKTMYSGYVNIIGCNMTCNILQFARCFPIMLSSLVMSSIWFCKSAVIFHATVLWVGYKLVQAEM